MQRFVIHKHKLDTALLAAGLQEIKPPQVSTGHIPLPLPQLVDALALFLFFLERALALF